MSLKKKIALSFFVSAFIIAILSAFEYVNFIEIRKNIEFLELTDTIRSKSLQLRRHEKNFFLYGPQTATAESESIRGYLAELDTILTDNLTLDKTGKLATLKNQILDYKQKFLKVETSIKDLLTELVTTSPSYERYHKFFPLIELAVFERPLLGAEFLEREFSLASDHRVIKELTLLDAEINALRKTGEEILSISKELDRTARKNTEGVIKMSKIAILIFFPAFLITGIGMLFLIGKSIVSRLNQLIDIVERTGKGYFSQMPVPSQKDEVGILIRKFNEMEVQLVQREEEIERKNKELLQSKKLAAIGTLASGVAHELNNPLNNIYISAQILVKETGAVCPPIVKEIVDDIVGQTLRVKRIVGDLLEYARGREPRFGPMELNELIRSVYLLLKTSANMDDIHFVLNSDSDKIIIHADREQIERVFINLFTNAAEAMSGRGDIIVTLSTDVDSVRIWVSDTGIGISPEDREKVFEPFFTTKDKGTGLGLAIVFNIIQKHKGAIFVDSKKDEGTTFYIILPRGEQGDGA